MGYTTNFNGEWTVTPVLTPEHLAYLLQFATIRHMRRDVAKLVGRPDPLRKAVNLELGLEGCYYVGELDKINSQGSIGGVSDDSIIDGNEPPGSLPRAPGPFDWNKYTQDKEIALLAGAQPGLWCQWVPSSDGTVIAWDEGEKFYEYREWIRYLLDHFLIPWGYTLDGEVYWSGEEDDDRGRIVIVRNKLKIQEGRIVYK